MRIPLFSSKIPIFLVGLGIVIVGVREPDLSFVGGHGYNVERAGKEEDDNDGCKVHPSGFQGIISAAVE
jgi:hypothetical protein